MRPILIGVACIVMAAVLAMVGCSMLLGAALLSPAKAHDHYGTVNGDPKS